MNDIFTFRRLKAIRTSILTDGKVDLDEIQQLLEFITPIARKNHKFNDFRQLLVSAASDQLVTEFESRTIATEINRTLAYIKKRIITTFTATAIILAYGIYFFATR